MVLNWDAENIAEKLMDLDQGKLRKIVSYFKELPQASRPQVGRAGDQPRPDRDRRLETGTPETPDWPWKMRLG